MSGSDRIQEIRDSLLEAIVACQACRPSVEGETIWDNPHTDLYDLLHEHELEEEEMDEVLSTLRCPNCDNPLQCETDQVEIKSEYDYRVDEVFEKIENDEIVDNLYNFNKFISQFPYLGVLAPGNIANEIISSIKNGKTHAIESEIWYRARKLNDESRVFTSNEMGVPDPLKVYIREGRYNHTGQSFLYLSNLKSTAFSEIRMANENICIIQGFDIKQIDNILDLRSNYSNIDPDIDIIYWAIIYNGYVGNNPEKKSSWKPEYFVPRFISDVARFCKYDGIIYSSAVAEEGENLVLFNFSEDKVRPKGKPEIYNHEDKDTTFPLLCR